ncbi:toxin-antitoxin system TumE family protein [Methylomagnum sp.]
MKAELLIDERVIMGGTAFAALKLWRVPTPVPGSAHPYKYRLAFVVEGVCVLRYDNEAGKGDHKHIGDRETAYAFTSPKQLLADFWNDVRHWRT